MELLLDTCAFLWLISGDERLSKRATTLIVDPDNDVFLSAASTWEIAIKCSAGKLQLPEDATDYVVQQRQRHGVEPLAIAESATLLTSRLPSLHRDPFDRILIAQALDLGLTLVSPDQVFRQYPVKVAW